MIYADNAATTKLDADAFEAMLPWLREEYGNASQLYSFARKPKNAIADARAIISACIGANPDEIYFTSGGTESNNWAIKGIAYSRRADSIITSSIEHHAILHSCASIARMGIPVSFLPVHSDGVISPNILTDHMNGTTSLVSIMLANNEIGTIEPIQELVGIAHRNGALFHTDAVQAVGHIPIDVGTLGVDMLSASAHKFNGPKGIGFLYIRKDTDINSYMDGGAQEFGKRAGTENVASIVGMAAALSKNCADMSTVSCRLRKIETIFVDVLRANSVDFIRNGSENRIPGNVSISIRGVSGEALLHRLDLKGIAISTGSACDSVNTQVSHVIKAIGVSPDRAHGTIRISFGRDNTESDAVSIAKAIIQILDRGRQKSQA